MSEIGPARARIFGHRPFQYRPFRTLAVSRSLAMVTRAPGRRPGRILSSNPKRALRGRTSSRHRRVSRQGKDHCRVPRRRLRRGIVDRPHPRSSEPRRRHSGRGEEGAVGPSRRQRRRRLPAALRRRSRQEEEGRRAQARAEELHRAPARDGRRPRGRGDRLAPARGAEPEGSGQADGVPRDHEGCDPARPRRDPRDRRRPRRRAGDAPDPRPALRLRGLARALDEGRAAPLRRPRAVGRDAARGRARARADEVRRRVVLGHRRHVRSRARSRRSSSRSRASASRRAATSATTASSRATCSRSTRTAARTLAAALDGAPFAVRSVEEKPYTPQPGGAVHDLDAAAGGEPQAPLLVADDDARRPAALRERLHHLHAHRLDDAVGVGARPRPARRRPSSTAPSSSRRRRAATSARSRTRRRPTRRSAPPATRSACRPTCERELSRDEHALYELVWKRTVASQMEDARGQTASLRLGATASDGRDAEFGASGTVITFRGFLAAYEEGRDDDAARRTATTSGACRRSRSASSVDATALEPDGPLDHRRPPATPRRRS